MNIPSSIPSGSQTLLRGLDIVESVADGATTLPDLAARLGLSRSTIHRLASALVERRYLGFTAGQGYRLGPKLLELGARAQVGRALVQVARPHLLALATATADTVHLGVRDGARALYLDKLPGRRRVEIGSRVGERQPLCSTGLGKALLLDEDDTGLRRAFAHEGEGQIEPWLARMRGYAASNHAFDLEENEDRIRCVAAPVRDATGVIVAAISLSSLDHYMGDDRMHALAGDVRSTARAISAELGWAEKEATP